MTQAPERPSRTSDALARARAAWSAGKKTEAAKILDRFLAAHADDAAALHLRGVVAFSAGKPDKACDYLTRSLAVCGTNADCCCDLGTVYHAMQRRRDAEAAYRNALRIDHAHLNALFNLGNVLREQMRWREALQCYTKLLERSADFPAWNNMGLALRDLGHVREARRCFEQALRIDAKDTLASANLGHLQFETGDLHGAVHTLQHALTTSPNHPDLHLNLGSALLAMGCTDAALHALRRAVQLAPAHSVAHSALICALDYDVKTTTRDQQHARRAWYDACIRPLRLIPLEGYRNPDPNRKLRIGYVSADLRATSAAIAFSPMLLQYDRERFDVFCYSNSVTEDALTETIRASVSVYRNIAAATDAEAAALIATDRIDILMDLSGHLRGHRLGMFAYRPAPLQGSAWGYANGTGLEQMDFLFADDVFITAQDTALFSERVVNLDAVIAYRPFDALPPVTVLPATTRGSVAFGCFSRLQKITSYSVKLWSSVLLALPDSNLILKAAQDAAPAVLEDLSAQFSRHGVAPARIRILPRLSWREHMESFSEIDIQLDPFPHGGGVSLLDGIAMGVPTLTLMGTTPAARLGAALLNQLGLREEWVAENPEQFVARAVRAGSDLNKLSGLRSSLRERLYNNPIGDTKLYVAAVEAAYRALWQEHCVTLQAERTLRLARARAAIEQGDGAACIASLDILLSADAGDRSALHYAGLAHYQAKDFNRASENLQRALQVDPGQADVWVDAGTVLTAAERYDEAIEALRTATRIHPSHFLAHANLGIALLKAGCLDEATSALTAAWQINPDDAAVLSNLGIVHERRGEWTEAEHYYQLSVRCDPGFALGHTNLGRAALHREQPTQAVQFFEKALALDPHLHWLRYELAIWYEQLGMRGRLRKLLKRKLAPETAAQTFDLLTQMIDQDAKTTREDRVQVAAALMPLAGRLMEVNHPAKIELLQQITELNPANLHAYLQRGIAHHHDGSYDRASAVWQAGLRKRDELAEVAGLLDYPQRVLDSSWTLAVGHLQLLDIYVKSMLLGLRPHRKLWLLRVAQQPPPNRTYLDYWQRYVNHVEPAGERFSNEQQLVREIGIPPEQLPLITDHFFADRIPGVHELWHMQFAAAIQRQWEAAGRAPLLQLSALDQEFGAEMLRKLGIPADAWYVCLHVRESGYWWKWDRYHASIRNADIDSYRQAIDIVIARGGWVIRMGDASMRPLPAIPQVIDYAHSEHKSERMDVFLCGSCKLFIGVNSGISLLPPTFGVPCLLTNFVPISIPFPYGADRMLPKRFRWKHSGALLTIEEMFTSGAAHYYSENHLSDNVEVIDNCAEEIADGVLEMLEETAISVGANVIAEFATLRQCYDDIVLAQGGFIGSPVAGRFLQRHRTLLNRTGEGRRAAA